MPFPSINFGHNKYPEIYSWHETTTTQLYINFTGFKFVIYQHLMLMNCAKAQILMPSNENKRKVSKSKVTSVP
jgi:hypothetical protein